MNTSCGCVIIELQTTYCTGDLAVEHHKEGPENTGWIVLRRTDALQIQQLTRDSRDCRTHKSWRPHQWLKETSFMTTV